MDNQKECCAGESVPCIDGELFGWCGYEECGGACEYWGECDCNCHEEKR